MSPKPRSPGSPRWGPSHFLAAKNVLELRVPALGEHIWAHSIEQMGDAESLIERIVHPGGSLGGLGELRAAAACAASPTVRDDAEERRGPVAVHAEGDDLVFSPGPEVANLAVRLLVFAAAVLDPGSPEEAIARGATASAASACSRDIGSASGAL